MGSEDLEEVEVDDAIRAHATQSWETSEKLREAEEYR